MSLTHLKPRRIAMNHFVRFAANTIFVSVICLLPLTKQDDNASQTSSQVIADCIDATAGLNIQGVILTNDSANNAHTPGDPLSVRFIYTSVTNGLKGQGFAHTVTTNLVGEDSVHEALNRIPDLTPIRQRLVTEKLIDGITPIATFTLYLVIRSDGSLSSLPSQTQEMLVFHEQELRSSGYATVDFGLQYDPADIEHYQLCLSTLEQFTRLTSDLNCQNIWVTIKMGDHQEFGMCWQDKFEIITQ